MFLKTDLAKFSSNNHFLKDLFVTLAFSNINGIFFFFKILNKLCQISDFTKITTEGFQ